MEREILAILDTARRLIREGNPGLALQAVVTALRISAGEDEVVPALTRARQEYLSQVKAAAAADDLSALFAEACAIAEEAALSKSRNQAASAAAAAATSMDVVAETSSCPSSQDRYQGPVPILAESGRMQVVVDASADGSSFVCDACGGLVSSARRDEHLTLWCSSLLGVVVDSQRHTEFY